MDGYGANERSGRDEGITGIGETLGSPYIKLVVEDPTECAVAERAGSAFKT
jgi:hypothetical protein